MEGWSLAEAAKAAEVSEPTAAKWVRRYRAEGEASQVVAVVAPADLQRHYAVTDAVTCGLWRRR